MAEKPSNITTPGEVRKMLNQISWYYRRTNALDIPGGLLDMLPLTLAEICKKYTN